MSGFPSDPAFPSLHIRPPQGWLNDPNGVCRIDGRYHVFFQYNAHAPEHDAIHWGHASSADLLAWLDEPVALHARPGAPDQNGCWSGCVVDDDGVPTAVYTAVRDSAHNAQVVLARSDRSLRRWAQDQTPVLGPPDDPAISDVRDPFVFTYQGRRYAIQGAGHLAGRPQILLYGCDDLTLWSELGPLLTFDDPVAARVAPANIWECPNLIQVDGQWVLIVSLWRWVEAAPSAGGIEAAPSAGGIEAAPSAGGIEAAPSAGGGQRDASAGRCPLSGR